MNRSFFPIFFLMIVNTTSLLFGENALQQESKTFLVFGGKTGWIGQQLVDIIKAQNHIAVCAESRLEDRGGIEAELSKVEPDYIINAAGITGRPNVDWCEDHQQETLRSNIIGALNLADIALKHEIHLTNFGTGCIYQYDDEHSLGSGRGFTEEDTPNFRLC